MRWLVVFQPLREYGIKVMEMSYFAADFFLVHFLLYLQTPILFFPFIDFWHSMILFWLTPKNIKRDNRIFTIKQQKYRDSAIRRYFVLYFILFVLFLTILLTPIFIGKSIDPKEVTKDIPLWNVIQPSKQKNNDTGPDAPLYILRTTPSFIPFQTTR